jgi:hypothetical protein
LNIWQKKNFGTIDNGTFWTGVQENIQGDLAMKNGGTTETPGFSWFQKFISTLPTK